MTQRSGRARVIALMNQKGGVGKTTSAVNLGAALARSGRRTLLIDLDPQAHLTLHVGLDPAGLVPSVYELLTQDAVSARQVLRRVAANLEVLPAHVNLAGVEAELAPKMVTGVAQRVLRVKCEPLLAAPASGGEAPIEFVLIDCPPSLGLLTINALALAREVLVPMQAHFLALQGLSQLLETVRLIKQSFNPELVVCGVLVCMHENQTLLAQEVLADLHAFLEHGRRQDAPWRDARVLEPAVRRNIKLAECPSFGKTIFDYEPHCHGAEDYRRLAQSLVEQGVALGLAAPVERCAGPPAVVAEVTGPVEPRSAESPPVADPPSPAPSGSEPEPPPPHRAADLVRESFVD